MSDSLYSMVTPRKRTRTPGTPRTPRTRQFAVSTTGTEVAHIETIEADDALRTFPQVLVSEIRQYLIDRAAHGEELDLAFARKGNTKLNVSGEGFPTYFVIPETDQKLDAGRYRYGLAKQSPIIVVVQQKANSTVSFNNGQPVIVLYHGKHSSVEGPNKVSKWALWGIDGLRSDTIVWRIAEGAKMMKTIGESDDDTPQKIEDKTGTPPISTDSHLVYGNNQSIFRNTFEKHTPQPSPRWNQPTVHYHSAFVENDTSFEHCLKNGEDQFSGRNKMMPIDPQLLANPFNPGTEMSGNYISLTGTFNTLNGSQSGSVIQNNRPQHNQAPGLHRTYNDDFHFFTCTCRGQVPERRNAEMAAAAEKVLTSGLSGVVNFNFRTSIDCETRLTKTLEDCRTMPQLFAYGRLHRTILLDHSVVSVHVLNGMLTRRSLCLVLDDVEHWRILMNVIMQELAARERDAREKRCAAYPLDLVVLDEGY